MSILVHDQSPPSAGARSLGGIVPRSKPLVEQRVVIRNVDWKSYQMISEALSERPALRITYDRGTLEIMPKSRLHEQLSRFLLLIIHILCEELNLRCGHAGSATLDREDLERGIEPDECFYLVNEALLRGHEQIDLAADPPPDLAIEIDVSRSSLNRLEIYAALRIPEAWRYDGGKLEIRQLTPEGAYALVPASRYFPEIPLAKVHGFLVRRDQTDDVSLMREFRAWVREQIASKPSGDVK